MVLARQTWIPYEIRASPAPTYPVIWPTCFGIRITSVTVLIYFLVKSFLGEKSSTERVKSPANKQAPCIGSFIGEHNLNFSYKEDRSITVTFTGAEVLASGDSLGSSSFDETGFMFPANELIPFSKFSPRFFISRGDACDSIFAESSMAFAALAFITTTTTTTTTTTGSIY